MLNLRTEPGQRVGLELAARADVVLERPGFASAGEAIAGLRHINGYPDQAPPRFGIVYGDPYFRERGLLETYEDEVHGEITAPAVSVPAPLVSR
jgi:crotonobetainyl-CoA:carnitine CoA-transferase CaiB-like acyl-CoA transferase